MLENQSFFTVDFRLGDERNYMKIFFPFKYLFIILFFSLSTFKVSAQSDNPAIATLLKVEGAVKVFNDISPQGSHGRHGMLLFTGNKILTSDKSKTTIEYRDGSRVRLFENSTIVLELSEEQSTKKRTFKFQLALKSGSLRGFFVKGHQRTKIRTPTADIGIKGSSVRISENNNEATVSLTEGQVEVSNLNSRIILNPGQWLTRFDRNTDLTQNVGNIPNLLYLKTAEYELDFRNEESIQLDLSVQLQNSISRKPLKRNGLVIFESDYKSIRLPKPFMLNERGFARVLIGIYPPSLKNPEFKGLITIRAFMDGKGFDDVAEGLLVLKILNLGQNRTLLIDPNEGVSKKQN